ncbi:hypothetical protein HWV62_36059 [Athelia sp. TMB]|nr:hypothetical protein HWV62_36059 [Athelia sp. TMB]
MSAGLLVATQLSSLFPSGQVTSVPLQTSRRDTPLPFDPAESDPPTEHAIFSTVLHTPTTGTVLLRVIHAGLIIELISLSTDVPPIRFVFPAPILSCPAIFLWESYEIHVLAVTSLGSLYRLALPGSTGKLWHDPVSKNWCREHLIQNVRGTVEGVVHVQGTHTVAIGLKNGGILRLETEQLGDDHNDDQWTETVFQQGSFLSSFTNILSSTPSEGSEIISMASHPQPTDIGHVWTLSRDRTLRLWTARGGCVSAKRLPLSSLERAVSLAPGGSQETKAHILLEPEPQRLLRVFSVPLTPEKEQHFVLSFSPTPSSTQSGGFFQLFSTDADHLNAIGTIQTSEASAHCHLQDFVVVNGSTLYVLWDKQGQSSVESTVFNTGQMMGQYSNEGWLAASYPPEPELTPAYINQVLLSPGSLTDRLFEAIMRPGMFSALTLRTAIDQYTGACLSLPGPPAPRLTATYASVGEQIAAVVGCTVNLNRDPHTGALQHANYWNALKRDWEGFIARCREVERSARWPLALGVGHKGEVVVVERERAGVLVNEDVALQMHRQLLAGGATEPPQVLLDILWSLRTNLGHQSVLALEARLVDIIHQEIAFPFADIVLDEAQRSNFMDDLDEGMESWIQGRLTSVSKPQDAVRAVMDIIADFEIEVKTEEDDSGLLTSPPSSDWKRALIAAYSAGTIDARYQLCLSLMMLLFFLAEDLIEWEPALLSEIFAVFRGVAMLRYLAQQPTGTSSGRHHDPRTAEDVITRMRDLNVSASAGRVKPSHSLIHCLLSDIGSTQTISGSAHHFLNSTALLQSISPAHVTKMEIIFCERLRLLGYHEVARETLAWLPRTPSVSYVVARLWLDAGRVDDAAYLFEKLAGHFGTHSGLSLEDKEALASVLPGAELFYSEYAFFLHVASLFKSSSLVYHDVHFSQLALSFDHPEADTTELWHGVIKGNIELALYDDAYSSLIACPHDRLKRECVSELVYRMCEENAVDKLMTFNFAGFADEVEDALAFKSRNVDPRVRPFYSRILYTWYTSRGDYRNSALTMYQRGRKLHNLMPGSTDVVTLAEEELEAYMVALNSLALIDRSSAWFSMPLVAESGQESRKRRKLSKHIPESKFATTCHDMEIIDLADIQYEYALLAARLDLLRKQPTVLSSGDFYLSPESIVLKLAQANRFNTAMATARSLKIDMSDLFAHLTSQCLRISRNPDLVLQDDASDWLLTDKVSSWPGTHADRSWRYLRISLARHDNADTDLKYSKIALETVLAFDRSSPPPPWLVQALADYHPEYLIRATLRFEVLELALEYTTMLIQKTDERLARGPPQNAASTWLPYALIDQVVAAADSDSQLSSRGKDLLQSLRTDVSNRTKRMGKLSQFPH